MVDLSFAREKMYKTKQEYVHQVLRKAIMQCEIPPGEKLVISKIASQLDVSAIPVREALQILHSERLVTYNQHIGAVITPITEASIIETFTIKEGLEGAATHVTVEKITETGIEQLEKQLAEMDDVILHKKHEQWGQLNAEFHKSIVKMAGMPVLEEMHEKMMNEWNRIRRYYFHEVLEHRHEQSQKDHRNILAAIKNGNADKAEQLTREHSRVALRDYMAYLKKEE